MVELFNKNDDGAKEIELLTGQLYASTPYPLVEPEIRFATAEITKLVGPEVMELAEESYESGENAPLVNAVRVPIASLAIMRYSALTTISHEHTGRKVKMDESERSPYEWQIDRDDRAMKERYYRALDAMYSFLEENEVSAWTGSSKRALLAESIVKDITQFEAVYPIDGSYYVYYMLQPLVIERQKSLIAPFAGENWNAIVSGTASDDILRLARRAAILSAVATAGTRWTLEVFPIEIARRFSPTYQGNKANKSATIEEIDWYLGNLKKEITDAMNDLAEELAGKKTAPKLIPQNDRMNKFFTTE
ncbi:MAG: hypothetical protein IJL58_05255 [Bacteroidales bacterium]|nr:hypothetical protein [Bacteroidales bacterium]